MLRHVLLSSVLLGGLVAPSEGQMLSSSGFMRGLGAEPPSIGQRYNAIVLLPTNPLTFNHLVKDEEGDYTIGPAIGLGAAATVVVGKLTYLGETSQLEPYVLIGGGLDFALREENGKLENGLNLSAMIGLNRLAVMIGTDLLSDYKFIGVGLKVDIIPLVWNKGYIEFWKREER